MSKYTPEIATQLSLARAHLSSRFARGYELVYDNYNGLVFGFGPTERASDAIVSVAGYPRWVTLFFLKGRELADPSHLLKGTGSTVRSIRLEPFAVLRAPEVQRLLDAAIGRCAEALGNAPPLSTVVKSVSHKQRPRRPPAAAPSGSREPSGDQV